MVRFIVTRFGTSDQSDDPFSDGVAAFLTVLCENCASEARLKTAKAGLRFKSSAYDGDRKCSNCEKYEKLKE